MSSPEEGKAKNNKRSATAVVSEQCQCGGNPNDKQKCSTSKCSFCERDIKWCSTVWAPVRSQKFFSGQWWLCHACYFSPAVGGKIAEGALGGITLSGLLRLPEVLWQQKLLQIPTVKKE